MRGGDAAVESDREGRSHPGANDARNLAVSKEKGRAHARGVAPGAWRGLGLILDDWRAKLSQNYGTIENG